MIFNLGEDSFKIEFRYHYDRYTKPVFVTCLLYKNGGVWHKANATWRGSRRKARKLALSRCIGTTAKAEGKVEAMSRPQRKEFWNEVVVRMYLA